MLEGSERYRSLVRRTRSSCSRWSSFLQTDCLALATLLSHEELMFVNIGKSLNTVGSSWFCFIRHSYIVAVLIIIVIVEFLKKRFFSSYRINSSFRDFKAVSQFSSVVVFSFWLLFFKLPLLLLLAHFMLSMSLKPAIYCALAIHYMFCTLPMVCQSL